MKNYTADEIRAERTSRGWNQVELGRRVGVSGPAVSKWENGQSVVTYQHMLRLNEIFRKDAPEPSRLDELEAEVIRLRAGLDEAAARIETLSEAVARSLGRQLSRPDAATQPDRADVAARRRAPRSG